MRVLLWHGWLLEGSGSNVYTARVAEELRAAGHDVVLVCQERHPERYAWIDAYGTVDADGPSSLVPNAPAGAAAGRCVLLRPLIGPLLPVFVLDEYEGFEVKPFVDLTDAELSAYLDRNAALLRQARDRHASEVVVTGHAIPGGPVGAAAVGDGGFVTKVHGSDVEYAIRPQARYRELAGEGLGAARAVTGSSADVLERLVELVPGIGDRVRVVPPGVDVERFRPAPRREALLDVARRLREDPSVGRGRPSSLDAEVERAAGERDGAALERLAHSYDQEVPDPDAAGRLEALAGHAGPVVGYFGKLIPQKGVELLLAAARRTAHRPVPLVVGFGLHRERLAAFDLALAGGDLPAATWTGTGLEPSDLSPGGPAAVFTGRLDHRYAPGALAAMDVLVVPSILEEAFGMVAAEGAAAGALPLVARHSGLAEVAGALEAHIGRPGLFSFEPGPGAVDRIVAGIDALLELPPREAGEIRAGIRAFVRRRWSWRATAEGLLAAARG